MRARAVRGTRQEPLEEDASTSERRPEPEPERLVVRRGPWGVRGARFDELRCVAAVQARVFHEPGPVAALDAFFLTLFEAEVYDVLKSKAQRNSPSRCVPPSSLPGKQGLPRPLGTGQLLRRTGREGSQGIPWRPGAGYCVSSALSIARVPCCPGGAGTRVS